MRYEVEVSVPCVSGAYVDHTLRVYVEAGLELDILRVFLVRGARRRELRIGAIPGRLWYDVYMRVVETMAEREACA